MYIYNMEVGAGKAKHRRYFIETDNGKPIAWFDDMDTAAIVLRYLKGVNLDAWERNVAHKAMKDFDHKKEGDN